MGREKLSQTSSAIYISFANTVSHTRVDEEGFSTIHTATLKKNVIPFVEKEKSGFPEYSMSRWPRQVVPEQGPENISRERAYIGK